MILPFYGGIPSPRKRPMTWTLLVVNVLIAVFSFFRHGDEERKIEKFFAPEFLEIQGQLYAQIIKKYPEQFEEVRQSLANQAFTGQRRGARQLGQLAMTDVQFRSLAEWFPFEADRVAMEFWRSNYDSFLQTHGEHLNYRFGLSGLAPQWYHWGTYMFLHAGFSHLMSNMWFLLVAGAMVEGLLGGLGFLLLYLGSGLMAAACYMAVSSVSAIPLVGASGAISGILAFYSLVRWQKKLRFLSLLFFVKWEHLMIYLPAWAGFAYWLIMDMAGYLAQSGIGGGVAHAAHLGGAALGVLLGLFFRWRKTLSHRIFGYQARI